MKSWKTVLVGLLCMSMLSIPALAAPSDWATEEVKQAIDEGFVPEELQSRYQQPITRGEFAKLAVYYVAKQLEYTPEELMDFLQTENYSAAPFSDTSDPYILAASYAGIVYGDGDGTFGPDRTIQRQEAAVMLYRASYGLYFSYSADGLDALKEAFISHFSDSDQVADWAQYDAALMWGYGSKGVLNGVTADQFAPLASYTREQSIAAFLRMEKNLHVEGSGGLRIPKKRTQEEAVAAIREKDGFVITQQWDTKYCVILSGALSGTPHGSYEFLQLVYPNGAARDVLNQLPAGGFWGHPPIPKNIRFSEDESTLFFDVGGTYDSYLEDRFSGYVTLPYADTYSVDLATGVVTPVE